MTNSSFDQPPRTLNSSGQVRRVGFEFEFAGVGLERSSQIVTELFGGEVKSSNRFCFRADGTRFGDFLVESDSSLLTKKKYEKYLRALGIDKGSPFGHTIERLIASASEDFVPFEIVTPPIPLDALDSVEQLREKLSQAGARGTFAHVYAAYGLQFNPEMPDFEVETLLGYMRAFFLSYDYLVANSAVPLARKILPFIDPFPEEYVEKVIQPDYKPSLESFMRDYLAFNPTRNRALDWLPLFAHIDRDLTFSYEVERDLIKPRPTLHYRLPSSLIDDPQWTIAGEWNKWVRVEKLAGDPEAQKAMAEDWLAIHGPLQLRSESRWLKRSGEWLDGKL